MPYQTFLEADGETCVHGAPLIEIHHVTIHLNDEENLDSEEEDPLEIYGWIEITNGHAVITHIYDQPEDNTETIFSGEKLCIIHDASPVYSPFPVTKIEFHLIDKTKGLVLASDTLTLNYTDKDINFEENGDETIYGKDGYVKISFTTFESAVVAEFRFTLCKNFNILNKGVRDDNAYVVAGTLEASYDCKYSFIQPFKATLLCAEVDDPLLLRCASLTVEHMPIFKSKMAVPVCSSLKISASFRDLMIDCSITCPVRHDTLAEVRHDIKGSDDFLIWAYVLWSPGNVEEKLQPQVNDYDQTSSAMSSEYLQVRQKLDASPREFSEVYSFVIVPDEKLNLNEVVNLHGRIDIHTYFGKFCVFETTESCPISFRRGEVKTLKLNIPFRKTGSPWLNLRVTLTDTEGRTFCDGLISWYPSVKMCRYSWYDKFICSTIKGDYGLVKVYHSIFEYALPAIVNVLSYFDDPSRSLDIDISGNIFSSYGKYAYDSRYYKDHFRNVLFSGSCSKLSVGCKKQLPLLKSEISVPIISDLIIEFDLFLSLEVDDPVSNTFKEVATFELGCGGSQKIRRKGFVLEVFVEWPK